MYKLFIDVVFFGEIFENVVGEKLSKFVFFFED